MIDKLLSLLPFSAIKKIIGSLVRHGVTALAGFIAAKDLVTPEVLDQFIRSGSEVITALVIFVVGLFMSFTEKIKRKDQVDGRN